MSLNRTVLRSMNLELWSANKLPWTKLFLSSSLIREWTLMIFYDEELTCTDLIVSKSHFSTKVCWLSV